MPNTTVSRILAGYPATVQRKKGMKRMILRVAPGGELLISASPRASWDELTRFVEEHRAWIEEKRAAFASAPRHAYLPGEEIPVLGRRCPIIASGGEGKLSASLSNGQILLSGKTGDARRAVEALLRASLEGEAVRLFAVWSARLGLYPDEVSYRMMKSRWGVCRLAKGGSRITLSLRLAMHSPDAIEYIIVHELTHLRHMGHDARFHAALLAALPDARERKAALREAECLLSREFPIR